ncbi:MAG TPA: hypothetical protein VFA86_05715 [Gammaproteobacteria bacterium]|nr:hypothetical protein [Gammaproteobacteria bacterium]
MRHTLAERLCEQVPGARVRDDFDGLGMSAVVVHDLAAAIEALQRLCGGSPDGQKVGGYTLPRPFCAERLEGQTIIY